MALDSGVGYEVDELGDVVGLRSQAGELDPVEPDSWGWTGPKNRPEREGRLGLDDLRGRRRYQISVEQGTALIPGPDNQQYAEWEAWPAGAAPPAAVLSKSGEGTLGYFSRLSEALGHTAERLERDPDQGPFIVFDRVGGRVINVAYLAPDPVPSGIGLVYFVTDGHYIKIGTTSGTVGSRIRGMQTGNPNVIRPILTILGAGEEVEQQLHERFEVHHKSGEWFSLDGLQSEADAHGGWEALAGGALKGDGWTIDVCHEAWKN